MKLNLLEKSILATVAYYDVLDYPLTGFEVFKYLISPWHIVAQSEQEKSLELESLAKPRFLDVLKILGNKSLNKFIQEKNGFYFLKDPSLSADKGEKIIKTRIERQKISEQKWRKIRKIIKLLQIMPYIRLIVLSGSLASNNAKEESDIDLLIIAKYQRIWTVRFLITFFIHIIGKRRYGKKTANRICLNHYITDESLKIDFPSLYNAQTYAHLIPVLELEKTRPPAKQGLYKRFQKANQWIENYLANYPTLLAGAFEKKIDNQKIIKENKFLREAAKLQEIILNSFIGDILEKIFCFFQKKMIKYHSKKNKGEGRVVADNFQLEFHPTSPEAVIIDNYNKAVLKLGLALKSEKDSGLKFINNY